MAVAVMDRFMEILLEKKIIGEENANMVMTTHQSTKEPVEKILQDLQLATKQQIFEAKAEQFRVEYFDLATHEIDREISRMVPEPMARRHKLICIGKIERKLVVAMANPMDIFAVDDIRLRTSYEVQPVLSDIEDIQKAWSKAYKESESWQKIVSEVKQKPLDGLKKKEVKLDPSLVAEDEAPIIRLVDLILNQAIDSKASDIHIEAFENELSVRYRIDGILHEAMTPPKNLHPPIVSRIKVMSNLDLAEKRLPQDGRMQLTVGKSEIDFRVSVVPALFGEKVVMRILDRASMLITLPQLGFNPENLNKFEYLIKQPHGIILVTGPTGSGKTTTLYAALNTINSKEINIMTIEDPVEYFLRGINQIQANSRIGLSFASGLRSFLRQDPDVIMVGEVRDTETAEVAIEAALTGHLVLSTLHTNDAVSSIARLVDMSIEPFLLASSLNAALAQRLVRKICSNCKEEISTSPEDVELFKKYNLKPEGLKLFKGKGCPACKDSGYKGRLGIYELLGVTDRIRELIMHRAPSNEIMVQAKKEGLKTLMEDGLEKVSAGATTLEEIWRVTKED